MSYYPSRPLNHIESRCWAEGWLHPLMRMESLRDVHGETDLTEAKFVADYIESADAHRSPLEEVEDAYWANARMGLTEDGTPYTQIYSRGNGRITLVYSSRLASLQLLDGSKGVDFSAPRVSNWNIGSAADLVSLGILRFEAETVTADVVTPQMFDSAFAWIRAKAPVEDGAHWAAIVVKKSFHIMA